MKPSPRVVTQMLVDWNRGNPAALSELTPLVYDELRRRAHVYLRRVRPNHTLQTTALVHEAYRRLVESRVRDWQNRAHFFGIAAHMMRCILADYARQHHDAERGGGRTNLMLEEAGELLAEKPVNLQAIDEVLHRLAAIDPRQSRIAELRFFGGLSMEEIAEVLNVPTITVKRDWSLAKIWLCRAVKEIQGRLEEG